VLNVVLRQLGLPHLVLQFPYEFRTEEPKLADPTVSGQWPNAHETNDLMYADSTTLAVE
jgi:hypothetical protein